MLGQARHRRSTAARSGSTWRRCTATSRSSGWSASRSSRRSTPDRPGLLGEPGLRHRRVGRHSNGLDDDADLMTHRRSTPAVGDRSCASTAPSAGSTGPTPPCSSCCWPPGMTLYLPARCRASSDAACSSRTIHVISGLLLPVPLLLAYAGPWRDAAAPRRAPPRPRWSPTTAAGCAASAAAAGPRWGSSTPARSSTPSSWRGVHPRDAGHRARSCGGSTRSRWPGARAPPSSTTGRPSPCSPSSSGTSRKALADPVVPRAMRRGHVPARSCQRRHPTVVGGAADADDGWRARSRGRGRTPRRMTAAPTGGEPVDVRIGLTQTPKELEVQLGDDADAAALKAAGRRGAGRRQHALAHRSQGPSGRRPGRQARLRRDRQPGGRAPHRLRRLIPTTSRASQRR